MCSMELQRVAFQPGGNTKGNKGASWTRIFQCLILAHGINLSGLFCELFKIIFTGAGNVFVGSSVKYDRHYPDKFAFLKHPDVFIN